MAMEWLKTLIENAPKADDGSVKVDALMESIQKAFPQYAVPKDDFNAKLEDIKA
ncbi:MAG: hypothetical protein GX685_07130, partial [Clostridiales bacterium]|nr:hypothetical protein [Clostridiales bacterium]